MKNKQNGFVVPLLIAIIVLMTIGGGVYVHEIKKTEVQDVEFSKQILNQTDQAGTQDSRVTTEQDMSNSVPSNSVPKSPSLNYTKTSVASNVSVKDFKVHVFGSNHVSYPADLILTLHNGFVDNEPNFKFPSSYFSGSNITSASINFETSVGNEAPVGSSMKVNGVTWTKTERFNGLNDKYVDVLNRRTVIYGQYGAGSQSFTLTINASDQASLNGPAAENIINIFQQIVGSFERN